MDLSLADSFVARRTRKGNFLNQIDQLIDWTPIEKTIAQYYTPVSDATGRPAYPGLLLFKMLLVGLWHGGLSDESVEDMANANLDHRIGTEVMTLLENLHHAGTTLIIVTHDRELGNRAHRQIMMRDGKIHTDKRISIDMTLTDTFHLSIKTIFSYRLCSPRSFLHKNQIFDF